MRDEFYGRLTQTAERILAEALQREKDNWAAALLDKPLAHSGDALIDTIAAFNDAMLMLAKLQEEAERLRFHEHVWNNDDICKICRLYSPTAQHDLKPVEGNEDGHYTDHPG